MNFLTNILTIFLCSKKCFETFDKVQRCYIEIFEKVEVILKQMSKFKDYFKKKMDVAMKQILYKVTY